MSERQGLWFGVLLMAVTVVEAPKYIAIAFLPQGAGLRWALLSSQLLMVFTPFLLARIRPTTLGFDGQWLPSAWSHWFAVALLVFLLLLVCWLHDWLMSFRDDWWLVCMSRQCVYVISPFTVILTAIVLIVMAPVAEEVFWRAFLLSQLSKHMWWPFAIGVQAVLFSLAHIPSYWSVLVACFCYGVILGSWRIMFRSLLPLVLAHVILNCVAFGPHLVAQYTASVQSYAKCREVDRLANQPAESALPALIEFTTDPSEAVSSRAIDVINRNYRTEAESYIATTLVAGDTHNPERLLVVVEQLRFSNLKHQVRAIVWNSHDIGLQISAVLTLGSIGDEEGLRRIAQSDLDERVRRGAKDRLEFLGMKSE